GHRRRARLGIDAATAHRVVARGPDLHRLLRDVDPRQLLELVVHGGQPPLDVLRVAPAGDVQEDAAVRAAPSRAYLRVDGAGHLVTGEQVRRAAGGVVGVPA